MVKMINFIRAESRAVGRWPPDLSSRDFFQSEHFLMPQLEDDALIYSLHDVIGEHLEDEMSGVTFGVGQMEVAQPPQRDYYLSRDPRPDNPIYRIAEMEQRVESAQRGLQLHMQLLASDMQLHGRLSDGLNGEENPFDARNRAQELQTSGTEMIPPTSNGDTDASYFASYSGHGKCFSNLARWPNADVRRYP